MVFAAGRPRARPAQDRRQRRLARGRPDQARRPRPLARLVDLHRLQDPARRQLEHPVRPARPERRQRGRRAGQARGLGPRPRATGSATSSSDGSWAYTPDANAVHRQHDLRGDLQPDHHRPEAVPGPGIPRRRPDPELRQGGRSTPTSSAGIDWMASHFQVGENFGNGQQWKYYYLYGLERAGRLTGIRFFGEHDWYREGAEELVHDQDKLHGLLAGRPVRAATRWSRPASPLLFLAKGRAPGADQQAPPRPGGRLEQRPRRRPQPRRPGLARLEAPAHLAGRRPQRRDRRGPAPGADRLLQRPRGPEFAAEARQNLRDYVEQGGFIFAEACCGRKPSSTRASAP